MKKVSIVTVILCVLVFTGFAMAASYDFGDATGYTVAKHSTANWQRLGKKWDSESSQKFVDTSDDGVFWSVNGGAYGHDEITAGDAVTFKFVMYKEMWGRHDYDYLKVWIDWNRDFSFSDDGAAYENAWYFKTDAGDAGQTPTTPYAYGDGYARIYKTFYYTITNIDVDPGDYWLRARVVCSADINSNPSIFAPTGLFGQGEVEDWKFTVNQRVPEPASLLLFGLGLLGLAGLRKRMKK